MTSAPAEAPAGLQCGSAGSQPVRGRSGVSAELPGRPAAVSGAASSGATAEPTFSFDVGGEGGSAASLTHRKPWLSPADSALDPARFVSIVPIFPSSMSDAPRVACVSDSPLTLATHGFLSAWFSYALRS